MNSITNTQNMGAHIPLKTYLFNDLILGTGFHYVSLTALELTK